MSTIKEIMEKHEKAYIVFKDTVTKRRFVSEALKEGVVFTNGSLPELSNTDEVIVLYNNKTIAKLGWAGRVKYHNNRNQLPIIDYGKYLNGDDNYLIVKE